jgi:hypothetical protein
MSYKKVMDATDNSRVYRIAYKRYLDVKGDIRCSICAYHRSENSNWQYRRTKSWKRYRKTQYKGRWPRG